MARFRAVVNSQARTEPRRRIQRLRVPPGPQQRLLHQVLGPGPVAVDQPQGVRVERVGVLVVQRAQQLGVVVADGGPLASGAGSPADVPVRASRSPLRTCRDADRFSRGPPELFTSGSRSGRRRAHRVLAASGRYARRAGRTRRAIRPASRRLLPMSDRPRLLPLLGGTRHGSRDAMTCLYRCGNACDHPVPNTSDNTVLRRPGRRARCPAAAWSGPAPSAPWCSASAAPPPARSPGPPPAAAAPATPVVPEVADLGRTAAPASAAAR